MMLWLIILVDFEKSANENIVNFPLVLTPRKLVENKLFQKIFNQRYLLVYSFLAKILILFGNLAFVVYFDHMI